MNRQIPKQKGSYLPVLVDLVEDKTRNRCIFPLCTLLLYVLIIVQVTDIEETFEEPPAQVSATIPFRQDYIMGESFTTNFPAPRMKVTNKAGPMPLIQIKGSVSDLLIKNDADKPDCDYMSRQSIAGTIEYIRMHQVCRIELKNESSVTDEYGFAKFGNFRIIRGPQGTYSLQFSNPYYSVNSDEYDIFLRSKVTDIFVDQSIPPPIEQQVNMPFPQAPKVTVIDENGDPIPNKYIVAFTWPEPKFWGSQIPYLTHPNKFAWLEGDIELTNNEGIAEFSKLKIKGSNSKFVYIYFAVDGLLVRNWGVQQPYYAELLDIQPYYSSPIRLKTDVTQLQIVGNVPQDVYEGKSFQSPFKIKVLNGATPLAGKLVFARISVANGLEIPMGYSQYTKGYNNKLLIKPFPGKYSLNYQTPTLNEDLLIPILTDSNGVVEFTDMFFSVQGPAGIYRILFECDGVQLESNDILVKTSVTKVSFYEEPISYINTGDYTIESKLTPLVLIQDGQNKGIQGKTPKITIIDSNTNLPIDPTIINLELKTQSDLFWPSDKEGFTQLIFKDSFLNTNVGIVSIIIKVDFDGVTTLSRAVTIEAPFDLQQYCGYIQTLRFPTDVNTNEYFSAQFKITDNFGQPLPNSPTLIDFKFISDNPTQFPVSIYPNLKQNWGIQMSDSAGEVSFGNIQISKGARGHILVRAMTYTTLSPTFNDNAFQALLQRNDNSQETSDEIDLFLSDAQDNGQITVCYSDYQKLLIKSKLETILISEVQGQPYSIDSSSFSKYTFTVNTNNAVKLQLLDYNGNPLINQNVKIRMNFLQKPLYSLYDSTPNNIYATFPPSTDASGYISGTIVVNPSYYGLYSIVFFADGTYSDALIFKTDFPSFNVVINTQPAAIPAGSEKSVGVEIGQFSVNVQTQAGVPIQNVTVVVAKDETLNAIMDVTDITRLGDTRNPLAVYTPLRVNQTSISGDLQFDYTTLVEVKNKPCLKFGFYVGEQHSKFSFASATSTNSYCFKSDKVVEITDLKYSKLTSQGNKFPNAIKIRVTKKTQTIMDQKGPIIYAAVPILVNNVAIKNPFNDARLYLSNFLCIYNATKAIERSKSSCSRTIVFQGSQTGPFFYDIEFKGLSWIQSAYDTKFKLSLSDPLNYDVPSSSGSVGSLIDKITTFADQAASASTDVIQVSNTPSIVEITRQPPEMVTVGDMFTVSVQAKIASGQPIVRASIKVSATPDPESTKSYSLGQMKDMIFTLASGSVDAKSLGGLTKKQNLILDPASTTEKTNRKGEAIFALKIISAMPGKYSLTFQAGSVKSDRTISFQVINKIESISFKQSFGNKIPVDLAVDKDPIQLPVQPIININFTNGLQFIGEKIITFKVYKWVDQEKLKQTMEEVKKSTNQTLQGMETLLDNYQNRDDVMKQTAMDTLKTFGNAVINGGKIVKNINQNNENLNITSSFPKENIDGSLEFSDLSILFKNYGKFYIVVNINGIESNQSEPFDVVKKEYSILEIVLNASQLTIIVCTIVFALLASTAANHYLWIILSLGFSVAGIILIGFTESPLLWKIFVWVTMGLIILVTLLMFIFVIKKLSKKSNGSMLFTEREDLFYEYTYQMLYKRPSKAWKQSKENGDLFEPYNDDKLPTPLQSGKKEDDAKNTDQNRNSQNEINTKSPLKQQRSMLLGNNKQDEQQQNEKVFMELKKNDDFFKDSFLKRSLKQRLISIFVPWNSGYSKLQVGDCFWFNQKVLAGSLLSLISIIYLSYQTFQVIGGIQGSIESMISKIKSANMMFMFTALNTIKNVMSDVPFGESQFSKTQQAVDFITDQMRTLGKTMTIGFYVAAAISLLIYVVGLICLYYDFKVRVMQCRRGEYDFNKNQIQVALASNYIGTQIANSSVVYLIILFAFGFIFTIVFHPILWRFIGENIVMILGLFLSSSLLVTIGKVLAIKFLVSAPPYQGIKHRKIWSIFELVMLYLAIAAGLLVALGRIIMLIVFSLVGLARLDQSIFPDWVNKLAMLDDANKIYLSMVYVYHSHNDPIAITFANLMWKNWEYHLQNNYSQLGKDKEGAQLKKIHKSNIIRNRFQVYLLLTKYPYLKQFRKNFLKEQKEKVENEKKQQQNKDNMKKESIQVNQKDEDNYINSDRITQQPPIQKKITNTIQMELQNLAEEDNNNKKK